MFHTTQLLPRGLVKGEKSYNKNEGCTRGGEKKHNVTILNGGCSDWVSVVSQSDIRKNQDDLRRKHENIQILF